MQQLLRLLLPCLCMSQYSHEWTGVYMCPCMCSHICVNPSTF